MQTNNSTQMYYFYTGVGIILLFGSTIRLWGINLDFWADEAWWASRLISENIYISIRPIGFVATSELLLNFSRSEEILRLPSFLSGVLSLWIIFLCCKKLSFHKNITLFIIGICAINPLLVTFSKEFKPYSIEILIHSLLILWSLSWKQGTPITRKEISFIILSILFSYSSIFVLPILIFLRFQPSIKDLSLRHSSSFIAKTYYKSKKFHLYIAILAITIITILFVTYEHLIYGIEKRRIFFGEKYDVFPLNESYILNFFWYIEKTIEWINLAGGKTQNSPTLTPLLGLLFITGVIGIIKDNKLFILLVLTSPIIGTIIANIISIWPFGSFRANLFSIPSSILIIGYGANHLIKRRWGPYLLLILIPLILFLSFPASIKHYQIKLTENWSATIQAKKALNHIISQIKNDNNFGKNIIIADWHSLQSIKYYLDYIYLNNQVTQNIGLKNSRAGDSKLISDLLSREIILAEQSRISTRIWLIISNQKRHHNIYNNPKIELYRTEKLNLQPGTEKYHTKLIELKIPKK